MFLTRRREVIKQFEQSFEPIDLYLFIYTMNLKLRNIPFSPPDMSEAEIEQVAEALCSVWITTGP